MVRRTHSQYRRTAPRVKGNFSFKAKVKREKEKGEAGEATGLGTTCHLGYPIPSTLNPEPCFPPCELCCVPRAGLC